MVEPVSAGRISKEVFVATSATFLAICLAASIARFYVRLRVQRETGWDDAFLLFGLCCLISGMAILYVVMDDMYLIEAMLYGVDVPLPSDILTWFLRYRRLSAASLILQWFSICAVKFSFLAVFRKLINRMPLLIRYWWFVVVYNAIVSLWGGAVWILSCPHFSKDDILETFQCVSSSGQQSTLTYSISQMVLDIVGDLFILVIPVRLIWKIRIRWTQKLALFCTLCLTIVMIILTIIRIAGISWQGYLDSVWETYFIVVAAEVGLTLVAITAFRTLFVAHIKDRRERRAESSSVWYTRSKIALLRLVNRLTTRTGSRATDSLELPHRQEGRLDNKFPRATMTGIRTFINDRGQTRVEETGRWHSTAQTREDDEEALDAQAIKMQYDISTDCEEP